MTRVLHSSTVSLIFVLVAVISIVSADESVNPDVPAVVESAPEPMVMVEAVDGQPLNSQVPRTKRQFIAGLLLGSLLGGHHHHGYGYGHGHYHHHHRPYYYGGYGNRYPYYG